MNELATYQLHRRQPRNLPALLALYESNYFRLMRLVPELERLDECVVSRVAGALDLYLTVVEKYKYTTVLALTYQFDTAEGVVLEPNARVCVYHDVRSVELLGHTRRKRVRNVKPWTRGKMPELDRKMEMNRFLHKWLKFCSHQGHLFLACNSVSVPPSHVLNTRF